MKYSFHSLRWIQNELEKIQQFSLGTIKTIISSKYSPEFKSNGKLVLKAFDKQILVLNKEEIQKNCLTLNMSVRRKALDLLPSPFFFNVRIKTIFSSFIYSCLSCAGNTNEKESSWKIKLQEKFLKEQEKAMKQGKQLQCNLSNYKFNNQYVM